MNVTKNTLVPVFKPRKSCKMYSAIFWAMCLFLIPYNIWYPYQNLLPVIHVLCTLKSILLLLLINAFKTFVWKMFCGKEKYTPISQHCSHRNVIRKLYWNRINVWIKTLCHLNLTSHPTINILLPRCTV